MNYSKPQTETVTYLDVTEPSEEIKKQLSNQSLLALKTHEESVQRLLNTDTVSTSTTLYQCTGQLSLGFAVFYNSLCIQNMDFEGLSGSLTFSGSGYGVGVGGGLAWYKGFFKVSPNTLLAASKVDYNVTNASLGTSVSFFINGALVGVLAAAGLTIGVGTFSGSGTFNGSVSQ